jgi:hypothetical protein
VTIYGKSISYRQWDYYGREFLGVALARRSITYRGNRYYGERFSRDCYSYFAEKHVSVSREEGS